MTDGGDLTTLTIDGKEVTVPKGTLIIRAAEQLGIEIPRFCDHPYLEPAGSCRQCYVSVEGQRKLMTSCTTPVAPGMVVHTQNTDDEVHKAQVATLEFLLLNHPLDCPICDRGGECPLQDQALAFGPGESRYREAKRTYEKPLHLSPLVALDRERCVLCARCTRFCDQISGDRFIELFDRGAAEQVAIAPGEDFRSPFSGNTIQICPVGALTSIPYRFVARPFDLKSVDSVCAHCASGCNLRADMRRGKVVRMLARDNPDVNDDWLCDKGRFAFQFPDAEDRVTTPLLRTPGLEPVSFGEALHAVASASKSRRVAFLAGGRLMDEDAYALSKLARTAMRCNDLDHRPFPAQSDPATLQAESYAASRMRVTNGDVEDARVILIAGLDAEQELPILHLRIRKAARRHALVYVVHPRMTRLWDVAQHVLCAPGEEADILAQFAEAGSAYGGGRPSPAGSAVIEQIRATLQVAGDRTVVLAGPRLAGSPGALARAAGLAASIGGKFAYLSRRAGDRGALRAGVHPGLLPGGRRVDADAERAEVEAVWGGALPAEPGRDTAGILEAAARREIDVLYLAGVDPLRDFPDAALARRALENVEFKVVQDAVLGPLGPYADVVLPAAAHLEKEGHLTNWEGRSQRVRALRGPVGLARPDWEIFQELSAALEADMGLSSLEALQEEAAGLLGGRDVDLPGMDEVAQAPDERAPAAETPAAERPAAESAGDGAAAEGLSLFTYPLLVDEGTLSRDAHALKEALEEPAFVEVHPDDAKRLGLEDGGKATVRTDAGSAVLPVRVSPGVAAGSCFVPFNQPGLAANSLLSGRMTASAALEAAP